MSGSTSQLTKLLTSNIALKVLMALTGLGLTGFVLVHMAGHLQMFAGKDAYNTYAHNLQSLGAIKWVARLGLLGMVGTHIGCAVTLKMRNQAARPVGYAGQLQRQRTSLAATIMLEGGLVVLAFIVYHLAHFTLGIVHTEGAHLVDGDRRDIFTYFVMSFQNPVIVGTYLVACLALAAHLAHGVQSVFKTLGVAVGRYRPLVELIGPGLAGLVFFGFILPPLACFFGLVNY